MALQLLAHPFSSYCQKVLIALYENRTPFEMCLTEEAGVMARLEEVWPFRRFPVLVDDGTPVRESTIIIEHLTLHHPGPVRLLPEDPRAALEVRFRDRFFDNYVSTPQQKLVYDRLRPAEHRDPRGVDEAKQLLETAYRWLDDVMADRKWAAGDDFSLADCAAAPALLYAHWSHPIPESFSRLHAYRRRLLSRPSYARVLDEARPYRALFPLGAPEED